MTETETETEVEVVEEEELVLIVAPLVEDVNTAPCRQDSTVEYRGLGS